MTNRYLFEQTEPKHAPETTKAIEQWRKVKLAGEQVVDVSTAVSMDTFGQLQAHADHAQREAQLAAKHGIDLSFITAAWEREIAEAADSLADRLAFENKSTLKDIVGFGIGVPAPHDRRVARHRAKHTVVKPRHGSRRGVKTTYKAVR